MSGFDLDAFKQGQPALTRDGRTVHFVYHDPLMNDYCRIGARRAGGMLSVHNEDGSSSSDCDLDLVAMATKKKQLWARAYQHSGSGRIALEYSGMARDVLVPTIENCEWLDPEPRLWGEYEVEK